MTTPRRDDDDGLGEFFRSVDTLSLLFAGWALGAWTAVLLGLAAHYWLP